MIIPGKKSGERLQDHWSSGLDLVKTSFHMCDSYVSAAINCRANLYTWFININDNDKGATAQLKHACRLV